MLNKTLQSQANTVRQVDHIALILGAIFLGVNALSLSILRASTSYLLIWLIWTLGAVIGVIILNKKIPLRSSLIFPIPMVLSGWGLIIIARLLPQFGIRQSIWLMVSLGVMLMIAISPHFLRLLNRYRYIILFIGFVLLISTIVFGSNPSGFGPRLWLNVSNFFFQPSEIMKILLVAFLASYLGEQSPILRSKSLQTSAKNIWLLPRVIGPILLMWGISIIFLILQRDLGTASIFFVVFVLMFYIASGYKRVLFGGIALTVIAAVIAYFLFAVVQLRIDIWLDPWAEADGRAYQIVQSLMAISNGGILGQGIGQGYPLYIPVVHSDFIFSAMAEEFGLIGIIVLIGSMLILIGKSFQIGIQHQKNAFNALLAIGLGLLIATQSILIMAGVIKLLPLTGVTLPFMSYGGSSLFMSMILTGILIRLSGELVE
ncbi:FtsW/RodA/SpoVE family cell cycle protein [Anaerolineales bacterium]